MQATVELPIFIIFPVLSLVENGKNVASCGNVIIISYICWSQPYIHSSFLGVENMTWPSLHVFLLSSFVEMLELMCPATLQSWLYIFFLLSCSMLTKDSTYHAAAQKNAIHFFLCCQRYRKGRSTCPSHSFAKFFHSCCCLHVGTKRYTYFFSFHCFKEIKAMR